MSALMARVAKVDVDQVYWGLGELVPLDQVKAGDFIFGATEVIPAMPAGAIYVAEDCDLPGGRYRLVKTETVTPVTVKSPAPATAGSGVAAIGAADAVASAAPTDTVEGNVAVMQVPVWQLQPLANAVVKSAPAAITLERALYEQLKLAHQTLPATVSPAAVAWAQQYETSWDADNGAALDYFRKHA